MNFFLWMLLPQPKKGLIRRICQGYPHHGTRNSPAERKCIDYNVTQNFEIYQTTKKRKGICTLSSRTTLVPPYSGKRTFSPTFTLIGCSSPFCKIPCNYYKTKCSYIKKKHFLVEWASHLVDRAWSSCHHSGLQHLPLRLFWQHDAPLCNCLCSEALYQHTVKQRQEFSKGL